MRHVPDPRPKCHATYFQKRCSGQGKHFDLPHTRSCTLNMTLRLEREATPVSMHVNHSMAAHQLKDGRR